MVEYPDTGESGDSYDVEIASVVGETGEHVQGTLQVPMDGMVNAIPLNVTRRRD